MISDVCRSHNEIFRGTQKNSMDEFIKKIFVACDKDQDGYLDRSDLEEVRNQIGLDGNISEILEQFGAQESGKISYSQFCENSAILLGELSESESSPEYYSTDSDTQISAMATEKVRLKNEESRNASSPNGGELSYGKESDLDMELKVCDAKIKQISATWEMNATCNPHRKSGRDGGIEDYLDPKTLQHLEELKILDPHTNGKSLEIEKGIAEGVDEPAAGRETSGPDYLEISKRLHLAALTSYKNEIYDLNTRLQLVRQERDQLRKQQMAWNLERQKMQQDFEDKLQSQTMRITELQSVIAELTRKLNKANGNVIIEEEEEEDVHSGSMSDIEVQGSHSCSECSCENCDHQMDDEGPNQVNLLATTHETSVSNLNIADKSIADSETTKNSDNSDLQLQLSNVLGALEERKYTIPENDLYNHMESGTDGMVKSRNANLKDQISELVLHVDALKRDKRTLEKQLHNISVQGYVYQKSNTGHVEEEFSKLRQENSYLRSKLRKAEQEVEEVKVAHIALKDDKERLKKQKRCLQETIDGKSRDLSPIQSSGSPSSIYHRSQSIMSDRPHSPSVNRSNNHSVENRLQSHPRSHSIDNHHPPQRIDSPIMAHRMPPENHRKYSLPSSAHSPYGFTNHPCIHLKGYTISPENSIRRGGQHIDSSDLGSSIGDESHRSELSKMLLRILHGRIPDTLLQTLLTYHSVEQVLSRLVNHFISEIEEKVREGVIALERFESRMTHLQSQNDLLQLSLDESKQNADRLSLLCGKYESNSTAWSLALQNTEQLIETYEVMLQLQESEADIYAANCLAGGINNFDTIKSLTSTKSSHSNISMASSNSHPPAFGDDEDIIKSFHKRKDAESQARMLLLRLDKKYENLDTATEEDLKNDESSYKSRTSTVSSQNSACTDTLSKDEEDRLRCYIKRLKTERGIYKGTVVELESVHDYSDRPMDENIIGEREHTERTHELNVDIEAAVTLQEMQALKEERAELKHRIYMLEKEKRALELKMNSREAQEQAYIVHIEHLKSEVKEQIRSRKQLLKESRRLMPGVFPSSQDDETMSTSESTHSTPGVSGINMHSSSAEEIPSDVYEATRRERKLKIRIQELVDTLESFSKNSENRHKQTAEYISDLKRANGALVTAYEKAKKRHASRLKKFEQQLVQMAEKYQVQVCALKEQIAHLKQVPSPSSQVPQTETSL